MLMLAMVLETASSGESPYVARWYQDHEGAISLRFDDALESHITTAVPLLNKHGLRATFMVIPGKRRYSVNREFWEQQLPAMGHRLGNHTMNHIGARDLQQAEYEIGEAARVVWRADPQGSRLTVFASGGGEKWGGKDWEQADTAYHQLADKYHQIDLYDGRHPSRRIDAKSSIKQLCNLLDRTADEQLHQPFHFHAIGSSLADSVRALMGGQDLSIDVNRCSEFLQCVANRRERLWVAPLAEILKYQEEQHGATVSVLQASSKSISLGLTVKTDPSLYDQRLTIVIPCREGRTIKSVKQDNEVLQAYQRRQGEGLVDVHPRSSTITIIFAEA